jgi:sortase A
MGATPSQKPMNENLTICPHLIATADQEGRPAHISPRNRCQAGDRPVPIGGTTQARVCLTRYHVACPYATEARRARSDSPRQALTAQAASPRPKTTVAPLPSSARYWFWLGTAAAVIGAAGLIVLFFAMLLRLADGEIIIAAPLTAPSPTQAIAAVASSTFTPTSTPTPTATATFTPVPTLTATPTPLRPPAVSPPTRLVVPALGVDIPVVEVGWQTAGTGDDARQVWVVADYAAGFHRTSAYPGRVGNTVISGHNNIRGEVFRDLESLAAGDAVSVYVGESLYSYTVSEVHILPERWASEEERQENARWIDYFPEERLTLVTCWPYEGNSHRVIVVAHPNASE